jgi:ankyrin repeat protein
MSQNLEVVNLLIEKMAELNARTQSGETALHLCCKSGNFDIVRTLTRMPETFVDIEDSRGNTPLHFAALSNSMKVVAHLTKTCKANPSIHNYLKQRPRDVTTDMGIKNVRDLQSLFI